MDFIGHYRKTKYDGWHLYVGGEVVAVCLRDPVADAEVRFPGRRVICTGKVMVDVAKETLS